MRSEANFIDTNYLSVNPTLANDNEFIPIHSLSDGDLITSKKTNEKTFVYKLNIPITGVDTYKRVSDFCKLLNSNNTGWGTLSVPNIINKYFAHNGILLYVTGELSVIPLLVVGVKTKYLFDIKREAPDPSKFSLVIDRSLINDEEHKKLFRNIKREYIDIMDSHIDVVYTNNLLKLCYNPDSITTPRFSTVVEMMNHSKTVNEALAVEIIQES